MSRAAPRCAPRRSCGAAAEEERDERDGRRDDDGGEPEEAVSTSLSFVEKHPNEHDAREEAEVDEHDERHRLAQLRDGPLEGLGRDGPTNEESFDRDERDERKDERALHERQRRWNVPRDRLRHSCYESAMARLTDPLYRLCAVSLLSFGMLACTRSPSSSPPGPTASASTSSSPTASALPPGSGDYTVTLALAQRYKRGEIGFEELK